MPYSEKQKTDIIFPKSKSIGVDSYRSSNARKVNKAKNPNGYLYILWNKHFNLFKIGSTAAPKRRIRDIRAGVPFDLQILFLKQYEDVYSLELLVQQRWVENRIKGEWFQGYESDLKETIELLNQTI